MYNYFARCFDSYESSSGINFKTYCTYCFTVFMSYSFLSNYCNRDPFFLHYKTIRTIADTKTATNHNPP